MIPVDSFLLSFVGAYWSILYAVYFSGSNKDDQEDKPIPVLPDDLSEEVMKSFLDNGIQGRENLKLFGVREKTLKSFYRAELDKHLGKNKLLSPGELQAAELNRAALEKFERECKESVSDYYFPRNQ
jgi:hypothetical protein